METSGDWHITLIWVLILAVLLICVIKGIAHSKKKRSAEKKSTSVEEPEAALSGGEEQISTVAVPQKYAEKKEKTAKLRSALAIAMPIYYGVLLIGSLICLFTGCLEGVFTNADEALRVPGEGEAYSMAILLLMASLTPALALYYGAASPYRMKKSVKVLLFTLGVVGMAAMAVVYMIAISPYTEIYRACGYVFGQEGDLFGLPIGDAFMFPATLIVGDIAFIVYYSKCMIASRGNLGKAEKVLSFINNENPKGLIMVNLLLTVLLPIASAILAFVIAFAIIAFLFLLFIGFCKGASGEGSSVSSEKRWTLRDEYGSERSLYKTNNVTYINGTQKSIYKDDVGYEWLTDDDGKHFYRK